MNKTQKFRKNQYIKTIWLSWKNKTKEIWHKATSAENYSAKMDKANINIHSEIILMMKETQ
jgi:hypothetical protein